MSCGNLNTSPRSGGNRQIIHFFKRCRFLKHMELLFSFDRVAWHEEKGSLRNNIADGCEGFERCKIRYSWKKRAVKCLAAKFRGGKLFGKIKFLLAAKFSSPPCYSVISSCTRSKMRFVPSNRNHILNFVRGYVSLGKCFSFSLDRAATVSEISQERWNCAY